MMGKKTEKVDNKEVNIPKFLKRQWLGSRMFLDKQDYVMCAIEDDVFYSQEEVNQAIVAFIEGGIK